MDARVKPGHDKAPKAKWPRVSPAITVRFERLANYVVSRRSSVVGTGTVPFVCFSS